MPGLADDALLNALKVRRSIFDTSLLLKLANSKVLSFYLL